MEGCNVDECLLQREKEEEEEVMSEATSIIMSQVFLKLKHYYKSIELLKSALSLFTSNIKVMFFMIFSVAPFFVFMVFYEVKLYETIHSLPSHLLLNGFFSAFLNFLSYEDVYRGSVIFSDVVEICVLYLVVYPLLELFSMALTVKLAARVHSGEKHANDLYEVLFYQKHNLFGRFVTCICVHLLSVLTLLGFLWILMNLSLSSSHFSSINSCLPILSMVFHSVIFMVLLYKYLSWSGYWNMGLVISILEEETGIGALGLSDYYGKHFELTGFGLMQICFAVGFFLRLPCLCSEICDTSVAGVLVTAIVIGLVCLKNLVKWIAVLLYFYDCKQQTLEKKVDAERKEAVKASEV